jgi:transcription elongation GreA/GreB family factor
MTYYFLKEDFDELHRKINELTEKFKKFSLEIGKDYQEDKGIFTFEEGERQKQMLSTRLQELIKIRNSSKIVMPNTKTDIIGLGSCATFEDESNNEIQTYRVGSYMVLREDKDTISYDSPLARLLIGAQVGDLREGVVGGKKRSFRIIKIR